jgi:hypothetical protein
MPEIDKVVIIDLNNPLKELSFSKGLHLLLLVQKNFITNSNLLCSRFLIQTSGMAIYVFWELNMA